MRAHIRTFIFIIQPLCYPLHYEHLVERILLILEQKIIIIIIIFKS